MRSPYCDATPHTQPERKRTCVNDGNRIARVAVALALVCSTKGRARRRRGARVPVKRHRREPDTRVHGRNHQKTAEGSCRQDAQPPITQSDAAGALVVGMVLASCVLGCDLRGVRLCDPCPRCPRVSRVSRVCPALVPRLSRVCPAPPTAPPPVSFHRRHRREAIATCRVNTSLSPQHAV
jgi:hypothetical protein